MLLARIEESIGGHEASRFVTTAACRLQVGSWSVGDLQVALDQVDRRLTPRQREMVRLALMASGGDACRRAAAARSARR